MNPPATLDAFGAFDDFNHAADEIMASLAALIGIDYWLVTRVSGDDWVVLRTIGSGAYTPGDVLKHSTTICSHMIAGRGPIISRDVSQTSAYASALIHATNAVASYAGAPIVVGQTVYGMLCAMGSQTLPEEAEAHAHAVVTASRTLSTILAHQIAAEQLVRRAERAETEALIDELTGLFNRRGWDRLVEREATRAQRYGNQATVFLMDVDELKAVNDTLGHAEGDELIRRVARTLQHVLRENDIAARLGGDEFGVLAVETSLIDAQLLHDRLNAAFAEAHISISIGRAHCNRPGGVSAAMAFADELMYLEKEHRHASRAG
jgi:diguanylate cyclase (GGDEF)-like protein